MKSTLNILLALICILVPGLGCRPNGAFKPGPLEPPPMIPEALAPKPSAAKQPPKAVGKAQLTPPPASSPQEVGR